MAGIPWQTVKSLADRPSLDSLATPYTLATEPVYRFDETQFAVATEQIDNRTGERARIVDRFLWSSGLAAVNGLILASPLAEEITRVQPPSELLLRPDLVRCEDILKAAR